MKDENREQKQQLDEEAKISANGRAKIYFAIMLAVLLVAGMAAALVRLGNPYDTDSQIESNQEKRMMRVTLAPDEEDSTEEKIPVETKQSISETEHEAEQAEEQENNWQEQIFGSETDALAASQIKISGISEKMKEQTGFRESDFVKAASAFLDGRAQVSSIEFQEQISCSSENAVAFWARLNGREDKVLNVIFFPDIQGKYLFTLQEAQKLTVQVQTETEQSRDTANIPLPQTEPPVPQTTESYDATRLTVEGMPATLLNYMDNEYDFKYSLYAYLYQNGYRDEDTVQITGYEIDADNRTAEIAISLSGGGNITCIYSKNNNAYTYYS